MRFSIGYPIDLMSDRVIFLKCQIEYHALFVGLLKYIDVVRFKVDFSELREKR